MWAPVDITAIPTAKELAEAKLAIKQVESELKDALLEQAQLRVANLEKNLKERRAWIAPIRRLSFDVLSLIFEFCGENSWRTPLRIAGVSQQWRYLVLATPRAWAFLPVDECEDKEDLIRHFFQHSGQRPLHVLLSKVQHLTMLSEVTERLKCLSVNDSYQLDEILVFPKLKRLSLRSVQEHVGLSNLCVARFPALRELICEHTITRLAASLSSSIKVTFPRLQVLSIATEGDSTWLEVLMGCRSSLVSLRLHHVDDLPDSKLELLLPVLRCLEIHLWNDDSDILLPVMKTPAIETYIESTKWVTRSTGTPPIHRNVENVTRIRIFYAPTLSSMSSLRTLQLEHGVHITDVLSQLEVDQSLCPRLELIEARQAGGLASYETSLFEVNRERSQPILISNVETWATALPYEIFRSSCGPDMPCSREYI